MEHSWEVVLKKEEDKYRKKNRQRKFGNIQFLLDLYTEI